MSRRVLVTGADGALGTVVCERLAAQGFRILGTFLERRSAAPVERWLELDLADAAKVGEALGRLEGEGWGPEAVVACAGGFLMAPVETLKDSELERMWEMNLKSAFHLARAVLPGMRRRGYGRIVFVSSAGTLAPTAGMWAYLVSKAGLNLLAACLTQELKSEDINVNCVLPTIVDTPANRAAMPKADSSLWVSPKAIAELVAGLLGPAGDAVRGALIPVPGRI